jgi:hypothetical protein
MFGRLGPRLFLKGYAWLVLVVCPAVVACVFIALPPDDRSLLRSSLVLLTSIVCSTVCFACGLAMNAVDGLWTWRRWGAAVERSHIVQVLRTAPAALPGMTLGFALSDLVARRFGRSWGGDPESYGVGVSYTVLIIGLFALSAAARGMHSSWSKERERRQALERSMKSARLTALAGQVSPHFLGNALSAVAVTIGRDHDAAEAMLFQLSEFYGEILQASRRDVHLLRQELDLCRLYLELESLRFGRRLRFRLAAADGFDDLHVPVLGLQFLVENAVKHGIARSARGGTIDVRVTKAKGAATLRVSNTRPPEGGPRDAGHHGIALANLEERLALLYGASATLTMTTSADTTVVEMVVPCSASS